VDVILLDVVMPGQDGLTIAREIRAKSDVGIIMLTSKDEVLDRVVGLEVGADDYIAKPFHLREVLARVKSVVRRRKPTLDPAVRSEDVGEDAIRFDGWCLDTARRRLVSPNGKDVALTSGEFDLLTALAKHPGRAFSRETLMEHTRERGLKAFGRAIDAYIARLRKKILAEPKK